MDLRIPTSSTVGHNVTFLSPVHLGSDVWIGDNVIVGHPLTANLRVPGHPDASLVEIGAGSIIRSSTVIYEGVRIGIEADIAHNALIRERSSLGDFCYIMPNAEIHAYVRIGDHVRFRGFACNRATIENNASMLGMLLHDYKSKKGGYIEQAPHIGQHACVGMSAVVIGGVYIGDHAVVGAGAVVTRDVAPSTVVVGNPARLINGVNPTRSPCRSSE
jgi:acetyltransferase-like isoleucine patch superfamily enzyme